MYPPLPPVFSLPSKIFVAPLGYQGVLVWRTPPELFEKKHLSNTNFQLDRMMYSCVWFKIMLGNSSINHLN